MAVTRPSVGLSVVAPAHDEEANLRPLLTEIRAALDPTAISYEIVVVDDGSSDATPDVLRSLLAEHALLRAIRMSPTPTGRGNGQSAAFHAGFRVARGELIATMDADRQNDPRDLPRLVARLQESGADMIHGDRSGSRQDTAARKFSSWVGRLFRRLILSDTIRDTGCSLRVMRREVALAMPLEYRGMHRFIPITARQMGYRVIEVPVGHRPRTAGRTKYGMWDRATVGLYDCASVRWMGRRRTRVSFEPVEAARTQSPHRTQQPAATVSHSG